MTVTAVNPQVRAGTGSTPAQTAGTRGAKSVPPAAAVPSSPPAGPRPRRVPLTPMRDQAAKSMSRLADQVQQAHPDLAVHQHVRDAARVLRSGNEEGAQRHLRAAIFSLTPQSLMRQGVHDDTGHMAARHAMHGVHRHLLLVKDIMDVAAKNQAAIRRDSYGDYESGPSLPHSPVRADPNAGYGPGALAQKPTARQPGGDRALNAPDRTNSGGSDPAVADPVGPQPRGSKQFARTWDDVAAVLDMASRPKVVYLPGDVHQPAWMVNVLRDGTGGMEYVVDLSAETGRLAVTPAPYGKPGGPGLYGVAGQKHSDYFEAVVQALMRKRGMDKGRASAIAYGALRRWRSGKGHVHPEVRAAASGALAEEASKVHGHASSWDEVAAVLDLAAAVPVQPAGGTGSQQPSPAKSANATAQARVGAGAPAGGQFAPAGSGGQDAHQQHVAHLQHLATHGTPAQKTAALAMLAKMAAKAKAPAAKTAAKAKAPAKSKAPAAAKTAKPTPGTTAKTTAKSAASKTASTKASVTAKAKAHTAHLAHVAHLQHLVTAGTQQQANAARAVLLKLGVKP
jgi:hypothetical protein